MTLCERSDQSWDEISWDLWCLIEEEVCGLLYPDFCI